MRILQGLPSCIVAPETVGGRGQAETGTGPGFVISGEGKDAAEQRLGVGVCAGAHRQGSVRAPTVDAGLLRVRRQCVQHAGWQLA